MDTKIITETIQKSELLDSRKQILLSLVPSLADNQLKFLAKEVDNLSEFNLVADYIFQVILDGHQMIGLLKEGQGVEEVVELLSSSISKSYLDFGKYLVPMVLDVRSLVNKGKIRSDLTLLQSMLDFEVKLFKEFPVEELSGLIRYNLLYLMHSVDVRMEFKRVYYYQHGENTENWGLPLVSSLKQNEEQFGSLPLNISGKQYQPVIKNWILDYGDFIAKPLSATSVFDEAAYMTKSSNVASLSAQDKKLLTELIKFYKWLLKPEVDPDEIEKYEDTRDVLLASKAKDFSLTDSEFSPVELPTPPEPPKAKINAKAASILEQVPTPPKPVRLPPELLQNIQPLSSINLDTASEVKQDEQKAEASVAEISPETESEPMSGVSRANPFGPTVNLQDLLNNRTTRQSIDLAGNVVPSSGVGLGGGAGNVDIEKMKKQSQEKRALEASQIEQRLQDLKKRKESQDL